LDITEQALFDNTDKSRLKYLKYILNNPNKKEIEFVKGKIVDYHIKINNSILADTNNGNIIANAKLELEFEEIIYLLRYAPVPLLEKLTQKLKSFKKISDDF
jgi:uncharacterized protein YllA (UPF0747 family)